MTWAIDQAQPRAFRRNREGLRRPEESFVGHPGQRHLEVQLSTRIRIGSALSLPPHGSG